MSFPPATPPDDAPELQDAAQPAQPLIVQIVGYKNTGKTTLVCRLTKRLKQAGFTVGTIKHDAHDFQMDTPGTDTWRHQEAGADITAISSSRRTAILKQSPDSLDELIVQLAHAAQIILVEGFKQAPYPKIVLARQAEDLGLANALYGVIAVAAWPEASPDADTSAVLPGSPASAASPGTLPCADTVAASPESPTYEITAAARPETLFGASGSSAPQYHIDDIESMYNLIVDIGRTRSI